MVEQPDISEALRMLESFASVGAVRFDLTTTDLNGSKLLFRRGIPVGSIRRLLPDQIITATKYQQNVIIRPHGTGNQFVQLDDLNYAAVDLVQNVAFLTLETSPGNHQAWIALQPSANEDFVRRLRKGTGADPSASGATRAAGSYNFKAKYVPDFPRVTIARNTPGLQVAADQLESLGLIAPPPVFLAAPRAARSARTAKGWPSYERCLVGAPANHGETGPDKSRADFTWCVIAIDWGWGVDATAGKLMEVSAKARENGEPYAMRTAARAAEAVVNNRQSERRPGPG